MASPAVPTESRPATGPRTAEGKARSSQNSRKHGLSAINLNVLPREQAEFDNYQNELLNEIKPHVGVQADLFRQLVHAGWSLVRLERYEFEILQQGNPFDSSQAQAKLDRLERYRASHRRAYSRILAEIRKLQTAEMLWATTHNIVRTGYQNEFPLADPASRPLNPIIDHISTYLRGANLYRRSDPSSRPVAEPLDKTNSPGPAAPRRPFGPNSIE